MFGMSRLPAWIGLALIIVLCVAMQGCFGSGTNTTLVGGWSISAPSNVTFGSPATRTLKIKLKSQATEHFIQMTAEDVPAGWTVQLPNTPIHLSPPSISEVEVNALVTIPAGETPGTAHRIKFFGTETGGETAGIYNFVSVLVEVSATTTGIRQVSDFSIANGVFESLLEVSWSETTPFGTLLMTKDQDFTTPNFAGPGEAVVWYSPKSGGLSLDPGDVDQVTVKVLPITNKDSRTFNMTNYIEHVSGVYGVQQSFDLVRDSTAAYEIKKIDYIMGVFLSDPDTTASYTVEFTSLLPGRYTFTLQNLPGRFSATLTPPFVDVSTGDVASVRVDVTRKAHGVIEDTEEFVLVSKHSSDALFNASVKLPIQSYVGR